jgi:hypothetical protein
MFAYCIDYKLSWNNISLQNRYIVMKVDAMSRDPRRQRYDWHKRDIMPKCVVSLVRHWFPNPGGFPYMGQWLTTRRIQHMLLFTQEVNVAMQPCVITCSYLFLFCIFFFIFLTVSNVTFCKCFVITHGCMATFTSCVNNNMCCIRMLSIIVRFQIQNTPASWL